jgi:hypothetical protein
MGGWRPRRDAFAESQRAFRVASEISDKEVIFVETESNKQSGVAKKLYKKAARCVDDDVQETYLTKKARSTKRPYTQELYDKLSLEVSKIIDKMVSVKREVADCPLQQTTVTSDVRLQNPDFVINVAVRQLIKRLATGEDVLNRSRIHDIVIYANAFCKRKREDAKKHETAISRRRQQGFAGDTKTRIINMVLAVWNAVCTTDYFTQSCKRGTDSFRPFVSGILYATKRGIRMSDGLEIVPAIASISDKLPTLHCQHATAAARQLQSSSHRGLCCLHRSIASFETADRSSDKYHEIKQAFESAACVAAQVRMFFSDAC